MAKEVESDIKKQSAKIKEVIAKKQASSETSPKAASKAPAKRITKKPTAAKEEAQTKMVKKQEEAVETVGSAGDYEFDELLDYAYDYPTEYVEPEFLKRLLDKNNREPIKFMNADGEDLNFEQIAVIPKDGKLYAILKPENPKELGDMNIKDDEALVFVLDFDENVGQSYLRRVTDEVDIEIIFQMYYDLLRDQGIDVDDEQ